MKTILQRLSVVSALLLIGSFTLFAQSALIGYKEITVTEPGTLKTILGEDWDKIDSVKIYGMINDDDIYALSDAVYSGQLSAIDLSEGHIEGNKIPDYAFCSDAIFVGKDSLLMHISLPEDLEEIGAFAFDATSLREITFPASLKRIGYSAFSHSMYMRSAVVELPEGLEEIGVYCFAGSSFKKLIIPSSLKTIKEFAFSVIYDVEEIVLSEGVETIEREAFGGCGGGTLRRLRLPSSLKVLGQTSFAGCALLDSVYCPIADPADLSASVTSGGECPFDRSYPHNPRTLFVPIGSAELYRSASAWQDFSIIKEMDFSTGLAQLPAAVSPCRVSAGRGVIRLSAVAGAETPIRIYGMDGRMVERSAGSLDVAVPAGVYLVRIGEAVQRVLVK